MLPTSCQQTVEQTSSPRAAGDHFPSLQDGSPTRYQLPAFPFTLPVADRADLHTKDFLITILQDVIAILDDDPISFLDDESL